MYQSDIGSPETVLNAMLAQTIWGKLHEDAAGELLELPGRTLEKPRTYRTGPVYRKLAVIGVRPFQVNGDLIGDRQKFFDRGSASLFFDLRIPLTQRIGHNTAHALPCCMDDCLREAMRSGVSHVKG